MRWSVLIYAIFLQQFLDSPWLSLKHVRRAVKSKFIRRKPVLKTWISRIRPPIFTHLKCNNLAANLQNTSNWWSKTWLFWSLGILSCTGTQSTCISSRLKTHHKIKFSNALSCSLKLYSVFSPWMQFCNFDRRYQNCTWSLLFFMIGWRKNRVPPLLRQQLAKYSS